MTASFVYDGDGARVKSTINGVTTSFVGQHYEVTNNVATKYYFAGASRIAMRTSSTLTYLLTDHLNSTSITTNSTGGLVSELRYKPWGETRFISGTTSTKYQYTGQFSYESDFGLMFYNARFYDSQLGRFTSADSIIPESQGVQAYDRYAYVNNNPVKYNDPTGHFLNVAAGAFLGAVVGIGIVAYIGLAHPEANISGGDILAAAFVGAAAGTLISTGVGIGAGTVLGATLLGAGTGAAGSAIGYTAVAGGDYNTGEMLTNAIIGAGTGAVGGGYSQFAVNAGMPIAGVALKVGTSIVAGELQAITSGHPSPYEIAGGGTVGAAGAIAGEAANGIPIVGPMVDDVIRSSAIEYLGNLYQDKIYKEHDTYHQVK